MPLQSQYKLSIVAGDTGSFTVTSSSIELEKDAAGMLMPSHRSANCVAELGDEKGTVVVFGGFGWRMRHRVSFQDVWTYNAVDGWVTRPIVGETPKGRSGCTAVAINGDVYIISVR